jgi:hypothetical protein
MPPVPFIPCQTIDEVIQRLDQILERSIAEHSKDGYFAALYRNVTVQVREWIQAGRFEDGPRMERLDVIFANRYLEALELSWQGEETSRSWAVAFQAKSKWPPVILQHLLLGMSAHINFDLAIAAVETAPGDQLPGLERDFVLINRLLDEMIQVVQDRINQVSPWFRLIDRLGGRTDEQICAFVIGEARELAWKEALHLSRLSPQDYQAELARHDEMVAGLGLRISAPGFPLRPGLLLVRTREKHPIPVVIRILCL